LTSRRGGLEPIGESKSVTVTNKTVEAKYHRTSVVNGALLLPSLCHPHALPPFSNLHKPRQTSTTASQPSPFTILATSNLHHNLTTFTIPGLLPPQAFPVPP